MVLGATDPESIGGYRLEGRLGSGGMGVVYDARSDSGRRVAMKLVHQQYADDDEFRGRFRQEVEAARRVSGAFTAAVVDADPDAVRPWMATSYVPGPTLDQRVAEQGPLSGQELRQLAIGLAEALRDIHRAGVIHRDLKPSNVILSGEGPRVIDFGISRAADRQTLTTTGRVMGTPPFMSPEALVTPREVGSETDVFALAAVLAYASSGSSPFQTDDSPYMTAYNVVHEPPSLNGLSSALREIAEECLAKDPAERPSVTDLLERFRSLPADGYAPSESPKGSERSKDSEGSEGSEGSEPASSAEADAETLATASASASAGVGGRLRRPRGRWIATSALAAVAAVGAGALLAFGPLDQQEQTAQEKQAQTKEAASSLPAGWSAWQRTLPSSKNGFWSIAGGRAILDGHTCLTYSSELYCGGNGIALSRLDPATGRALWKHPESDTTESLIGVSRHRMVVATVPGRSESTYRLEGYGVSDGKRRWSADIGDAAQGDIFRSGRSDLVLTQSWDAQTYVAVDAETGKTRWSRRASQTLSCYEVEVVNHRPYALCHSDSDTADSAYRTAVYALDPATGRPEAVVDSRQDLTLVGSQDGKLVLVDSGFDDTTSGSAVLLVDPRKKSTRRVPLSLKADQEVRGLIGGTLYFVRPNGEVSAVRSTTGKELWKESTRYSDVSGPVVAPGTEGPLYFGTPGGGFLSLDAEKGSVRWTTKARTDSGGPSPDLALIGDALYGRYGYDQLTTVDVNRPSKSS
ncbi:protein kinase domain-containing protein [Streptomyces spongiae]|uniref:serine/threonine-protein kinase n=1 Tax=Streptomyces spongiae TaxID=565072 RepID=UPI002AD2AEB5|nr:protein kinase [Streptomyces spongiae]